MITISFSACIYRVLTVCRCVHKSNTFSLFTFHSVILLKSVFCITYYNGTSHTVNETAEIKHNLERVSINIKVPQTQSYQGLRDFHNGGAIQI